LAIPPHRSIVSPFSLTIFQHFASSTARLFTASQSSSTSPSAVTDRGLSLEACSLLSFSLRILLNCASKSPPPLPLAAMSLPSPAPSIVVETLLVVELLLSDLAVCGELPPTNADAFDPWAVVSSASTREAALGRRRGGMARGGGIAATSAALLAGGLASS